MVDHVDWDSLYGRYRDAWSALCLGSATAAERFEPPAIALSRLAKPTERDSSWLTAALEHGGESSWGRKWFVADLCRWSGALADVFFAPMLNAAIDEVNPSYNRHFVEPCLNAFGPRRVNEHLLCVIESGTDFRKAGAVNALYWAQAGLSCPRNPVSYDIEHATPESRSAYEALQDIRERRRRVLLDTFVTNSDVDVRRSIIPSLDLDPQAYPDSLRSLVISAIDIARSHEDEYIRRRVEVQLGDVSEGLAPLPHREKGSGDAARPHSEASDGL